MMENREVNIAGYCIFIFSNILQNEILVFLPLIFHIIATNSTAVKNFFYSLWEKHCASSLPFLKEHITFFFFFFSYETALYTIP